MISLEREKLLSELEQKIGYSFRSRALLDRSLTHRSFANERVAQNCRHNEAMEFLGDAVLGFVVSAWLLECFPDLSEGKLSKMKAFLVSEASLVELAEEIDLGRYILLNRGEEKTGGRRKRALLADAYEALIGVIYIDGGIATAESFLRRELRAKVQSINPSAMIGTDFKSALQERLQAGGGPGPEYAVVDVLGPDHRRTFCLELRVGGQRITRSEGHSIKLAQQEAARRALEAPELLNAALAAYHERRAAASNRHHIADEPQVSNLPPDGTNETEEPAAVENTSAPDDAPGHNPSHNIDDDNPFLAIAEELEANSAQHKAKGSATAPMNGSKTGPTNGSTPTNGAATGAALESAANIEDSAANVETAAEGETDVPRGVATDAST